VPDLHELDVDALLELGPVLKNAELLLRTVYSPFKVIFAKLGFSNGFACHFHVAPVTNTLLAEIASHPDYADEPDGNDTMLFLSRNYCERALTLQEQERIIGTVSMLQLAAANQSFQSVFHRVAPLNSDD
jgi:hypothetical protein